ncbi:MAG: ABC transporter permease [Dethiobacteria bacterium]|nr:ABC transporter permease [Bacillota bacterium]MDW7728650.1 ABC transporter permease [Bacillota bacterium]
MNDKDKDNQKYELSGLLIDEQEDRSIRAKLWYLWRLLWRDKSGLIGLTVFLIIVFTATFASQLSPHDPLKQNLHVSRQPPVWVEEGNAEHILGTDNLGRDIFSRIIYGARVSIMVGFLGVSMAFSLGMMIGLIAGYKGGRVDSIIMTLTNMILALPYLVFVVFVAAILGRSLLNVILIFGLTDIPIFVRVTRGEVLRLREEGYIEAAVSIGQKTPAIIFKHIMPNLLGPLITLATFEMSAMIFYEAGLGFLGLSVPPTIPSWGNMLAEGRQYLTVYPWMSIYPGLAIVITGFGMNLFGDWLRDALDPRLRRMKK